MTAEQRSPAQKVKGFSVLLRFYELDFYSAEIQLSVWIDRFFNRVVEERYSFDQLRKKSYM